MAIAIEFFRELFLGQRHTHGVSKPLTKWTSCRLYARTLAVFWVSGSLGVQFAEVLDVL